MTRLHTALLRTEPGYLLLGADDLGAYALFDAHPRPPLWEPVLARGRADLARLRSGDRAVGDALAEDAVRRRLVLRAAQFDRTDDDLALLRPLLRHEASGSMTDELRLAAVLVGLHGDTGDLPLLHEVRETDLDTACGLGDLPGREAGTAELRRWAQELDDALFGTDPADEPAGTWTDLAMDQGMTELARAALIRELDRVVMDQGALRRPDDPAALNTAPLHALATAFERLGDLPQALRAQRLYAALQDTARDRVSARRTQARLEREAGQPQAAAGTLATLRTTLGAPGDDTLRHWRQVNLGRLVAEEHYALARALDEADHPEEARSVLAAGDAILGELSENAARGVRELAEDTAAQLDGPRGIS
ncbi:hypothetical protein ACWCPM_11300 [Streptomyces sp. NPDC002309]